MNLPTNRLPRKVPPSMERKYPTFMVMTANMLYEKVLGQHTMIHIVLARWRRWEGKGWVEIKRNEVMTIKAP